jgi:hypothetical protein
MAQEQVELEFREDIQQMSVMQQNPMMAQNPEMQTMIQNLTIKMEARKAKLEAEMTIEFMKEEQRTIGEFGNDPIAKLRARELDLKAMDDQRKRMEGQERIDLDRMKSMMNQSLQRDKMEQNEDLAELRADTSLTKTQMSIDGKLENDRFKQRDVRILKGPRR